MATKKTGSANNTNKSKDTEPKSKLWVIWGRRSEKQKYIRVYGAFEAKKLAENHNKYVCGYSDVKYLKEGETPNKDSD